MANTIRFFDEPNGHPLSLDLSGDTRLRALSVGDGVRLPVNGTAVLFVVTSVVHWFKPDGNIVSDYLCERARQSIGSGQVGTGSMFKDLAEADGGGGSDTEPPVWPVR